MSPQSRVFATFPLPFASFAVIGLLAVTGTGMLQGAVVESRDVPFEPLGPSSRRSALSISELMYDTPSAWGGTNSLEFIELYNSGLVTEDLTGHRLSGEVDYTFPDGTSLAPDQFLVVARDPGAALSYYGVNCLGPYTNKLANNGGTLRLRNELNGILLELEYDSRAPWPAAAAGTGHSLVLSHPSYGENDPRAWSISDQMGGSPGTNDLHGTDPADDMVINEFLAHTDLPQVDFIELFNAGEQPVDLSGAWLSDAAGTNKFRIPETTTIPGRGFLSYDETQLGFALSADGEEIFLVNSNQTRVLDAVNFRGQENGVSSGRYPDGSPGVQELFAVTPGATNNAFLLRSVVINEIMYHPISESNNDEYIELYNRTASPLDLSGWRLQGGVSYQFPTNTVIGAHGYMVVAENRTNLLARYAQLNLTNTYGNYSGALNNRSERVALSMPDTLIDTNAQGFVTTNLFFIVVDEVTYLDGGRWGQWSDGGGSSLELIDPDADNRFGANWADSDESSKAAWTTIDVTDALENGQTFSDQGNYVVHPNRFEFFLHGAGEVIMDDLEFRNNGGGNLINNGDFSNGLSGWSPGGTLRNSDTELGVGIGGSSALHVVSTGRGDIGANKMWSSLNDNVDTGFGETGTIRAMVRWLKGSPYILLRNSGNWIEVSERLNVPTNCGTPGLLNSQHIPNAGPTIEEISHTPVLPLGPALVTARVADPDGVSSVTLRYRLDPSTTYTTTIMRDTGTAGDAVAGDGIYTTTMLPRPTGTIVAYYISATDTAAATRLYPPNPPERECLIRWGDTVIPGSIGTYRLWITQSNTNFWKNREENANDPIDATFVYGNSRVIHNVDTLYSGSPFHSPNYDGPTGSFPCDYEVNFSPGDRLLGSKPTVLTAYDSSGSHFFLQDASGQVDLTGNWIARKLGMPHDYRRHIHVVVNGHQRGTIYDDVQQPNREFLDMYFSNDSNGDLRKTEDWFEFNDSQSTFGIVTARLTRQDKAAGGIDPKRYRWNWRPRVTRDPNNWFAFTNLIAAVNDTVAPDYEARVRNWMDLRNFLRPIITHHICGSWDSYGYQRGKNMYAYKPDDEGWRLLMWDIELAMNYGGNSPDDSIYNIHDPALASLIFSTPAFFREYLQGFQEAVDLILAPGVPDALLDERYASFLQNGVPMASPTGIKNWLSARRSYLQGELPVAPFDVDGPTSFSVSSNSLVLTGSAPLQVNQLLVNGIPYPIEWTGITTWKLQVPVTAGLNSLQVTGVDRFGADWPGASVSLSVTYTGVDADPAGHVVIHEIHPSPEEMDLQFVELFNTHSNQTFDVSDWRMNGLGYTFPPGSIVPPQSHLLLVADPFRFSSLNPFTLIFDVYDGSLDPGGETLTLFRPGVVPGEEIVVDRVRYESVAPWSAATNGSSLQLVDPARDNARVANWASLPDSGPSDPVPVIGIEHMWDYYQTGDPGSGWESVGFNDNTWSNGAALLYVENSALPAPKNTELTLGETAYYFRTTFDYPEDPADTVLELNTVIDDGMVLYLNGTEIHRLGMNPGPVNHNTLANRTVINAEYEGPFQVPASALVSGENVLAAEVHQASVGNPDIVLGLTLAVNTSGTTARTPASGNSVAAPLPAFPDIWLNELQADNISGPQDNVGDHDPWIELHNVGPTPFSLDGYYLTDNYNNLTNWAFPIGLSIPASGFLLVWCDGEPAETIAGVPHTDFALPSSAGRVGLVRLVDNDPQVVDYLNYTNLPANRSYGDVPDGQPFYRQTMFLATPGATNSNAAAPLILSINEWLADNDGVLFDPADGGYEDWFELYNPGTNTADLGGYYLTDDLTDPFQYEVPNNGHYLIPPGGFLLVWADGEPGQNSTNRPDLHADFSLSKAGESIGVFASDGTPIDAVTFGPQVTDVTEGRFPNGAAGTFAMATPTPRQGNLVPNTPPSLEPIGNYTLTLGQTLNFTASALDTDIPPQSLIFSLQNEPVGASIHPTTGAFSWPPASAPVTNTMDIVVTDNGTPNNLSASRSFTVTVVPTPTVGDLVLGGNQFSFTWPSVLGQEYQVYYKDDLQEVLWNPIGGIRVGTGGLLNFINVMSGAPERYFRVGVLPQTAPPQLPAPTLGNLEVEASTLSFEWLSLAGYQYQVQSTDDLNSGVWSPVGPSLVGDGSTLGFTNTMETVGQRYFRVAASF